MISGDDNPQGQADLAALRARVAQLENEKVELLASVGRMIHDIRTPLSAILGYGGLLQEETDYGDLSFDQREAIESIEFAGRELLNLTNDLSDLFKIEAGKLELHLEEVSLDLVCRRSLDLAAARDIGVTLTTQPEYLTWTLLADGKRLSRVLFLLLKTTAELSGDTVMFDVLADATERRLTFVITSVPLVDDPHNPHPMTDFARDKVAEANSLFVPAIRLTHALMSNDRALTLIRFVTELHGGTVQVEYGAGHEVCFTLTLPWRTGEPDAA